MKGLVITAIIGLVFFGGAYAFSTMQLVKQQEAAEADAESEDDSLEDPQQLQTGDATPRPGQIVPEGTEMPVPFSPKSLSERAILELTSSVKQKEIELKAREDELTRRETKMRFILEDINNAKREFESVVMEAENRITEGQRILKLVETKKQKIENDLKQIQRLQNANGSSNRVDLEKGETEAAKMMESMEPATAAATITSFVDKGELDKAGYFLSKFQKKSAAKVIAELSDDDLRRQVLNAVSKAYAHQATNDGDAGQKR